MIKRLSILIVLLFSVYAVSYADEQKKVTLNDSDRKREVVEIANSRIVIELIGEEANGNAKISIKIENIDESKSLCLFNKAYNEKALKKMLKIKYDKVFPGTKGERVIDACFGVSQDIRIAPTCKEKIFSLSCKDGETTSCRLPLYIIETKDKNYILFEKQQLILLDKEVIELEIEVALKFRDTYNSVKDGCDKLIEEYDEIQFCTNKKHKPSLEEQKEDFQRKIDVLVSQIDSIVKVNYWFSSDERYKLYQEQKERLINLDLSKKEGDCGEHIHKCSYCRYTPRDVLHKLEDIHKRIYNSSNRSTIKKQLLRDVNAVYACPNAKDKWVRSEHKVNIIRTYNEIKQL